MKYIITIMIFALSFSCSSKQTDIKKDDNKDIRKEEKKDVKKEDKKLKLTRLKDNQTILEAAPKMEWIFGKNFKNWKPELSDIETAENLLDTVFYDQKRGTVNRLLDRNPEDYHCQFVGAETENGEKIIWINCFCNKEIDSFKDWKTRLIYVADGGNCFFNVKINITKKTYTDVNVNGMP